MSSGSTTKLLKESTSSSGSFTLSSGSRSSSQQFSFDGDVWYRVARQNVLRHVLQWNNRQPLIVQDPS
jgi:hypothetical protein